MASVIVAHDIKTERKGNCLDPAESLGVLHMVSINLSFSRKPVLFSILPSIYKTLPVSQVAPQNSFVKLESDSANICPHMHIKL